MSAPDAPTSTPPSRRSWRDLPASPPVADFLPPPDPTLLIPSVGGMGEPPAEEASNAEPESSAPRSRRKVWLALAAVAVLIGAVGAVAWQRGDSSGQAAVTTPTVPKPSDPSSQTSVEKVAKALGPAVVQIEVGQGLGSGVIYDSSGLILTAQHVVEGTDTVTVRTADKQELPGRVVARDAKKDLAIVAVSPKASLTAAPLAGSGTVQVGETAIALGSPFGFSQTVTAGIVSGLDRELDSPVGTLTGLIQTDAPINPGNSGGPLADANAKVIGINTAIASASGGSDGVGFAIPVEQAKDLMDQVKKAGGAKAPTTGDNGSSQGNQGSQGGQGSQGNGSDGSGGLTVPPGLENLIPGLQNLLPDLGGLLPGGQGSGSYEDTLRGLLNELSPGLGDQLLGNGDQSTPSTTPDQGGTSGASSSGGGSTQGTPSSLALIQVPSLPSGYTQQGSTSNTTDDSGVVKGTQIIALQGPDGPVTIAAERGDGTQDRFDALSGTKTTIAGHDAVITSDTVAFMADRDLLVIVHGGSGVSPSDLKAVAQAVEVVQ